MSKEFIRGSQIGFHYVHMFAQSIRKIVMLALMVASTAMFMSIIKNSNIYIYRPDIAIKYLTANLSNSVGSENEILFKDVYGQTVATSPKKYITWYQSKILPEVKKQISIAIGIGLKWFTLTFVIVGAFLYFKGLLHNKEKHLRGMRLVKIKYLRKMIFWYNIYRLKFNPYKLAGTSFPKNTEFQHTIITGASGTGKTQVMLDLLSQIRERGEKAIIYDKMGSYVRKFYDPEKDIILNPFDERSKSWDFFGEGVNKTDFDIMAASLIPENPRANDPFWYKAPKTVLTEAAFALQSAGEGSNQKLCDFLLKSSAKNFSKFLSKTEAAAVIDEKADKTAASIRSVLSTYINPLKFLTNNNQPHFSIREWVKNDNKDSFLFLSSIADKHESIKPLISLWADLAVNSLLSQDQQIPRRIWFIFDELPSLQRLPALTTGLAESRQFGGAFVISAQLNAQLRDVYGKDGAESISGLCRNRLTFGTPDKDTAIWCSDNLGRKEIITPKENISFGASEFRDGVNIANDRVLENLVLPAEIMNLKDLEFYIKFSNGFPIAKNKISYRNRLDVADKIKKLTSEITTYSDVVAIPLEEEIKEKKSEKKNKNIPETKEEANKEKEIEDIFNKFF